MAKKKSVKKQPIRKSVKSKTPIGDARKILFDAVDVAIKEYKTTRKVTNEDVTGTLLFYVIDRMISNNWWERSRNWFKAMDVQSMLWDKALCRANKVINEQSRILEEHGLANRTNLPEKQGYPPLILTWRDRKALLLLVDETERGMRRK